MIQEVPSPELNEYEKGIAVIIEDTFKRLEKQWGVKDLSIGERFILNKCAREAVKELEETFELYKEGKVSFRAIIDNAVDEVEERWFLEVLEIDVGPDSANCAVPYEWHVINRSSGGREIVFKAKNSKEAKEKKESLKKGVYEISYAIPESFKDYLKMLREKKSSLVEQEEKT